MKRGLIILLFLGLSWGSVFGEEETITGNYNGNFCEISGYFDSDVITKIICHSNEDEKLKQELDWEFNDYLIDNYYYLSQDDAMMIYEQEAALKKLEQYKNTYDNYNYYLGQLSLFIGEAYYKGYGYIQEESGEYVDRVPDVITAQKYFKIYEANKDYKLKRAPYNFLMTYLNTSQEDMIEKKVDEVYEIFKNNISSLSTEIQNNKKTELIAKINSVYNEENSDFVKYTLLYLKYIIQEEIYRYLVDLYKNGEYEKVVSEYKKYSKFFDYSNDKNYTQKYRDIYYDIKDVYLEAYIKLLRINNNQEFYIQAEADFAKIKGVWNYRYYSGMFSCYILGKYIYLYPWDENQDAVSTCDYIVRPSWASSLLERY